MATPRHWIAFFFFKCLFAQITGFGSQASPSCLPLPSPLPLSTPSQSTAGPNHHVPCSVTHTAHRGNAVCSPISIFLLGAQQRCVSQPLTQSEENIPLSSGRGVWVQRCCHLQAWPLNCPAQSPTLPVSPPEANWDLDTQSNVKSKDDGASVNFSPKWLQGTKPPSANPQRAMTWAMNLFLFLRC